MFSLCRRVSWGVLLRWREGGRKLLLAGWAPEAWGGQYFLHLVFEISWAGERRGGMQRCNSCIIYLLRGCVISYAEMVGGSQEWWNNTSGLHAIASEKRFGGTIVFDTTAKNNVRGNNVFKQCF